MYEFSRKAGATLEESAELAVKTIYTSGLMLRNGEIVPGGNNVMADKAAANFTPSELTRLQRGDDNARSFATIISLRQTFASMSDGYSKPAKEVLAKIDNEVQVLTGRGWTGASVLHAVQTR